MTCFPAVTPAETPLHEASREDHVYEVALLLAAGANVNAKNSSGNTPLYMAVVKVLLAAGSKEEMPIR